MEQKKELLLGLFVFSAIILLLVILLYFDKINIQSNYYNLRVRFNDVSSLTVGVPVLLGGVKVGTVDEIYVENNSAIVKLSIKNEIKIKKGAVITIAMKGLVGDLVVNIYNPEGNIEYYTEGDILQGKNPISMSKIMEDLYGTMQVIEDLGESINKVSTGELEETLKNINTLTKTMNETLISTNELIKSNKDDLNRALYNAGMTLDSANKIIEENRESVSELLTTSNEFIIKLESMTKNRNNELRDVLFGITELLSETRGLINENSGKIGEVVENLEKISIKTENLLSEVEEGEITKFKKEISDITKNSKEVINNIKSSMSGEGSQNLKESVKNTEKITNNVNSLLDNDIMGDIALGINSKNEIKLSGSIKVLNNSKSMYIKLGKNNIIDSDNDYNFIVGRHFNDNILGIGAIDKQPGIEYGYRFNDFVTGGFKYFDFDNNIVILNTEIVYEKAKIELEYKLEDEITIGAGYKF